MKSNPYYSRTDKSKIKLSNHQWREILDDVTYYITREKGTEPPFSGAYNDEKRIGDYYCKSCGQHLFKSTEKFSSGCGWPSFTSAAIEGAIEYTPDYSHNMSRIEVTCSRCDGHLGHVFDDGPAPLFKRYCINSLSLDFVPE